MDTELTWEQEQDIADYEAWQAEQAWEAKLAAMVEADITACEAEQEQLAFERDYDDYMDGLLDAHIQSFYDGANQFQQQMRQE